MFANFLLYDLKCCKNPPFCMNEVSLPSPRARSDSDKVSARRALALYAGRGYRLPRQLPNLSTTTDQTGWANTPGLCTVFGFTPGVLARGARFRPALLHLRLTAPYRRTWEFPRETEWKDDC